MFRYSFISIVVAGIVFHTKKRFGVIPGKLKIGQSGNCLEKANDDERIKMGTVTVY
jgi:hypothetical protein